jgi:prepilin-type N-terminal cleavage/methylation domain-containing protein/prepilin-type processing-associated H-X9-DG protein
MRTFFNRVHRRGFTLIELLVVISIVAVLMSLVLPSIEGAREAARRQVCASNLRQVHNALSAYDRDYLALPPGGWNYGNTINGAVHVIVRDEYNIPRKAITCPSSAPHASPFWNGNSARAHLPYWYIMGNAGRPSSAGSEANGWLTSNFPSRNSGFYAPLSLVKPYTYPSYKPEHWMQPLMSDISWWRTQTESNVYPNRANHAGPDGFNTVGQNMLFADGHVEWQLPELGKSWEYFGPLNSPRDWMWITAKFAIPATKHMWD